MTRTDILSDAVTGYQGVMIDPDNHYEETATSAACCDAR